MSTCIVVFSCPLSSKQCASFSLPPPQAHPQSTQLCVTGSEGGGIRLSSWELGYDLSSLCPFENSFASFAKRCEKSLDMCACRVLIHVCISQRGRILIQCINSLYSGLTLVPGSDSPGSASGFSVPVLQSFQGEPWEATQSLEKEGFVDLLSLAYPSSLPARQRSGPSFSAGPSSSVLVQPFKGVHGGSPCAIGWASVGHGQFLVQVSSSYALPFPTASKGCLCGPQKGGIAVGLNRGVVGRCSSAMVPCLPTLLCGGFCSLPGCF